MQYIQLLMLALVLQITFETKLMVPLYVYPAVTNGACSDPSYTRIALSEAAAKTTVILNPNNGPQGVSQSTINNYKTCIIYLQNHNVKVIGYVHTKVGYPKITGFRTINDVRADILSWKTAYSTVLNGIFVDEVSTIYLQTYDISKENVLLYYASITTFIQTTFTNALVFLNPGNPFYPELISSKGCNVIGVVFESPYSNWQPVNSCLSILYKKSQGSFSYGPWCPFVPNRDGVEVLKNLIPQTISACQIAALIYKAPSVIGTATAAIQLANAQNVGSIYITDQAGWSSLASDPFWTETIINI